MQYRNVANKAFELVRFSGDGSYAIYEIRKDTNKFVGWPMIAAFNSETAGIDGQAHLLSVLFTVNGALIIRDLEGIESIVRT